MSIIRNIVDNSRELINDTVATDKELQGVPLKVKGQLAITKGQAVMFHGFSDAEDAIKVNPTILQSDICIGIACADIPIDTFGYVITRGLCTPIDTSAWSAGTILYSNGGGGYTVTKPLVSYQAVAYVLRSHAVSGAIMVSVDEPNVTMEEINTYLSATKVSKDSPTGASFNPAGTTAQRPISPSNGYMRYNTDLSSMEAYSNGSWGSVGGGSVGGGQDKIFYLNGQTITTDYTIPVGQNAMTTGDITIANGVTVTIGAGSKWVIL